MKPLYLDIHILQDVPPSNINRDENGTPKHATYGGVERLRVSSQAWKRATRKHFQDSMDKGDLGVRTRRLQALLSGLLVERGLDAEQAETRAHELLTGLKLSDGKKVGESQYLLFAGRRQLEELADAAATSEDMKSVDALGILGSTHPLDVALFGRMVANMTQLNVDAATQVAHAISTHGAQTQFDYFTAVDDQQEKDEAGAGMIGLVEFNSAILYRFATVGLHQLVDNMGDLYAALDGVGRFVRSFALSMPSGHQNSFAPRTRPSLVALVVRDDQPVNLVNAFETPVWSGKGGLMALSQTALADLFASEGARWGDAPLFTGATFEADATARDRLAEAFGASVPFAELVDNATGALATAASSHG